MLTCMLMPASAALRAIVEFSSLVTRAVPEVVIEIRPVPVTIIIPSHSIDAASAAPLEDVRRRWITKIDE